MSRLSIDAPLVGRRVELQVLADALTEARGGRPGAVLLAGDAGAGKTRVLEAFAAEAAAGGAVVLRGHCVDFGAAGLPYLAFAEALGAHLSATSAAVPAGLRTLLGHPVADRPATRDATRDATGDGTRHDRRDGDGDDAVAGSAAVEVGRMQLFEQVARFVGALASTAPVLLVLEDLHWADPSSRDLLRYLLGRMRREQVLVVASYRSDDLHRAHPVRGLLGDLARLPHVRRVELAPFDLPGMTDFLAALAGRPVAASTVRHVLARSEGNAYFAEELFAAGDRPGVPDELAEVLLDRLERLGPQARQVARLAAVGGRRVADDLLLAASGLDRAALDEALREAVSAQVLRAEGDRYAFRHALLQEAVYADLLPGERSRWHAAYVAALAVGSTAAGDGPGTAAELAHHALAAHDLPTALVASVRAAEDATELLAPRDALAHLERAIELFDSVPDAATVAGLDAVDLHRRAAGYASRCGRVERAVALAREALRRAEDDGDPGRVALLHHRLGQHLIAAERVPDALPHAEQAVAVYEARTGSTAPADRDHAWALAGLARALMLADRPEARAVAEAAHEAAVRLGTPDVEADTLATLAVVHSDGEVPAAVRDARLLQALERARESTDVLTELRASVNLSWSRYARGDVEGALQVLEASCDRAAASGLRWSPLSVELRVLRRVVRYVAGRWGENPEGDPDLAPDAAAARLASAGLYVQVGRGDAGADAAVQRLVAGRGLDLQVQLGVDGCLAELRRWQGRSDEAADLARAGADDLARCHGADQMGAVWLGAVEVAALADVAEEAALRHDDALVGALRSRAQDRVAAVAALYAQVAAARPDGLHEPGPEVRAWLARARAELGRLPDGLSRPDDPVGVWREALTAFGYGYPYEQARCELGLADALLRAGRRGEPGWEEAESLLARAAATAAGLGARPLARAVAALARRAGLALPDVDRTTGAVGATEVTGAGGPTRYGHDGGAAPSRDTPAALTAREQDVLRLVARGWTNRRVGAELFISEKTVSVHLSNVMAKLGASGRTDAVSRAHRAGLLSLGG